MSGGNFENKTINDKVNIYTHSLSPGLDFGAKIMKILFIFGKIFKN